MKYRESDIKLNRDGDLEFEDGDLAVVHDEDCLEQDIHNRVQTNNPDWFHHPGIGADLEDVKGLPNEEETAEAGATSIYSALTYGGCVAPGDLDIRYAPTGAREITFYNVVDTGRPSPMVIPYSIKI